MGTIKDRNGLDLTEAEDIKKRWQEYNNNVDDNKQLSEKKKKMLLATCKAL